MTTPTEPPEPPEKPDPRRPPRPEPSPPRVSWPMAARIPKPLNEPAKPRSRPGTMRH